MLSFQESGWVLHLHQRFIITGRICVVVGFPVTKVGLVDFLVGMLTCSGGLRGLFN